MARLGERDQPSAWPALGGKKIVFCPQCGNAVSDEERFCRVCGRASTASAGAGHDPSLPPAVGTPAPTSGKAIASLVLGLLSFTLFAAIPAIVFGHIALSEVTKSAGRLQGRGMAIAGLVLGYLGIAMLPFILIIAAIAIPNVLRARIAANEASAVGSLRTLEVAEVAFVSAHPDSGYTCSLSDLWNAGLITPPLSNGTKNGYVFALQGCASNAPSGPIARYQIVAYPIARNQGGVRAFCSDESGVVKADLHGTADDCLANGAPLE